ncbi:MAG: FtsX-like permease family protein, partial [Gammaproteobacteria bacterium]
MDLRYIKTLLLPSLRAFKRDVGDPHFLMIGTAIVIAVASVTAVDMFTDRVRNALARQSSTLLAADLAIASNDEIPLLYRKQARALNLNTTETLAMRSVVAFGESLQLTELKAVAAGYPLRGKVLVASAPFVDPAPTTTIPESGTVWVEARLLPLIHAAIGDRIRIGRTALEISKILVLEPDRGGDLFNIAPRVLLNQADIAATGLISPGSRVRYSLLLTGEKTAIGQYSDNLNLRPGDRILSPANARPEIRTALRRTEHYLGLASFTTIILAGVAIALAAASFAAKHKNTVALLRTLGATRRYVLAYFSLEVLLLGIFTATLGAVLGAGCQEIIAELMVGWIQTELPPPMAITALHAALIGLVALVGFALPPLMTLRNVPPLRVLRSDADAKPTSKAVILIYALTACSFIAPWRAGDMKITAWSLGGLGVCLAALILTTLVTIKLISRRRKHSSIVWQFGIANLARRGTLTVVQVAGLGLGMMALLVLGIARNDLFDSWITNLPPDAPNQFLINIQPKDVADLERFFQRHELNPPDFY